MGRSIRGLAVLAAMAALTAIAAASASASTGQITRALATPDWSQASIAGSVTWTGCEHAETPPKEPPEPTEKEKPTPPPPRYCGWIPFLTVGPGTEASDCSSPSRQWPDKLGPGVVLAWEGTESRIDGSIGFEVNGVPLDGKAGQLACLSVVEIAPTYREMMAACEGGTHCDGPIVVYEETPFSLSLASALLLPEAKTRLCTCPPPGPRHRHHHHVKHRHRHMFVSQHQKVS